MAQIDLITKEDLELLKQDLIRELSIIVKQPQKHDPKQWLRSVEVRKLLHISPGTLQNFRINGTLSFTKVGGIFFYKYDDILKVLEKKG
ncbi:helix-turn-helix domain-containing protein [Mucilaginibacter sp.]|uniref:helix-turn-helix domain-containing protein n=1 Tax=Mucilaginibacter sp. TaxID=1882438 RepID=UPI003B007B2E